MDGMPEIQQDSTGERDLQKLVVGIGQRFVVGSLVEKQDGLASNDIKKSVWAVELMFILAV